MVCGMPWREMYDGDAQVTVCSMPMRRATRLESSRSPERITQSTASSHHVHRPVAQAQHQLDVGVLVVEIAQ